MLISESVLTVTKTVLLNKDDREENFKIMKWVYLLASAIAAEKITYTSCGAALGNQGECEQDTTLRTFGAHVRDMLTAMVCPDGNNTPKEICQGPNKKIWGTVFNYGCNCNQDNFRVNYTSPTSGNSWYSVYPGSNGRFVDDFDKVCHEYNNKFKCFNIDKANSEFGNYEQYGECHYWTSYTWHMNENNIPVCGPAENPEYQKFKFENDAGRFEWNQCRLALCQAERELAMGLAPFLESGNFRQENQANYGLYQAGQCTHVKGD